MNLDALADALAERLRVPQHDRLIGLDGLCDLLGVSSKTTVGRIAAKPGFPKRIMIMDRQPRWVYGEVLEWVKGQR